jgi:SAM-dependent methyltransferase
VAHTETTAWGRTDSGKQLNVFKGRMFLHILEMLKKHCAPPADLLDIGCSYGGFLLVARCAGYRVRGFDLVPQAVESVIAQGIPADVCCSVEHLPAVALNSLDVVTCIDSNYYWVDQPAELGHIFRKLKPGGYLAMRVADKSWMVSLGLILRRLHRPTGERAIRAALNDHRFSMPLSSLLNVLQACGFEIAHASPRGAVHSYHTAVGVKLSFLFGALLWHAGVKKCVAPGAVVLARKPN